MPKSGIYIHMPFCKVKCMYCDFYSVADKDEAIPTFFEALIKEIEMCEIDTRDWIIDTIFIGGGTPSLMTPYQLENLIKALDKKFELTHVSEFTLEANPGEAPLERLKSFRALGVNRISLGVQSLQKSLLQFLTRIHDPEDVFKTFDTARQAGFENINCDLIFSIPNQTMEIWEGDLKRILDLGPEHMSCYSLTVEKGTQLYQYVNRGKVKMPNDDQSAAYYRWAQSTMADYGYRQYEISNWSKPKLECNHNFHYWEIDPYLAFGPSAHGFDGKSRFSNINDLDSYINKLEKGDSPLQHIEKLTRKNYTNELIGFGLRINKGINLENISNEFKSKFDQRIVDIKYKWGKYLIQEGDRLRLTEEGYAYADAIAVELLF